MNRNSCIVVTGANGLAGSAIVENLRKDHTCVIPLTRKDANLLDSDQTIRFFDQVKPEYVFHAAATVYGLQGNMDNQYKSIFENTLINTHVINAARLVGVKDFIAMGSNCVYPTPPVLPYREVTIFDGRPDPGEAGYGHAKRHMLAMLEASEMDYTYLVSGNLYGPRDKFDPVSGHVIPSMIHKFYEASRNEDEVVSLWGNGHATRDFLYSEDLAEIVRAVLYQCVGNGAMNIGSGVLYPLQYIAKRLCGISGVDYDRVQWDITKPQGRPACYADLTKMKWLDFRCAQHEIGEGLKKTFDWYSASR